jgi:Ca2+-binding RTX toxin-like protein
VAAANLGQVGYYTGASAGSNAIAIEAIDNLGLASPNFVMMTIGVAGTTGTGSTAGTANQAPTISGPASVSKAINESFAFTSLIAAADADGTVAQYRFSDSTSGAGYLTLNGAVAPSVFTVAAADLAKVGYYTGLAGGSNSIAIEAIDNMGLASPGLLLTSIKVSGSGLSSNASSGRTVISSDGVGEAALIGTGGLLTVEAGASSANFSLHASGSNGVISDITTGGIRYTFSNFSEFLFNGGAQGDTVKVGVLAGTSIGFQSVFLNGNGGNDTLDASAADRSILATGGAGQDRLFGGSQNDRLSGDAGDDQLSGGKGDDVLTGGDGNDIFSGLEGRDVVNGGAGDDVLQFTDLTTHAITALRSNSFMVTDAMGNLAIVRDVEHIQLAGSGPAAPNSSLAQDSLDQRVVELYVAAFGRAPETQGYDFWVDMESREGLGRVADTIFSLPVVKAIYADSMSANQFVTAIYENVFDRAPDVQGLNFWVNMLGSTSRGSLVLAMTSAALGVADGTQGKDFFENRVDWAMFAVHYQDATHNGLAPVYLHTLTDSVTADAASLITLVGQFEATLP